MPEQYILTLERLSKAYNKREVIKDMTLAFFPGAKIGVIGGNGTGKSTLLRILAGVDKDYLGEVRPAPGVTIGYVPQEPRRGVKPGRPAARRLRVIRSPGPKISAARPPPCRPGRRGGAAPAGVMLGPGGGGCHRPGGRRGLLLSSDGGLTI